MSNCPTCRAPVTAHQSFCHTCGVPLTSTTPGERTVLLGRDKASIASTGLNRPVALDVLFATKRSLVVGRDPSCDLVLAHPSISRRHATLERLPDGRVRVRDLGSVNGVLAQGRRIKEPLIVAERQRIGIGPYLFGLADGLLHSLDSSRGLRLEARELEREVRVRGGTRKLLAGVNLAVEPGEFVCLLGPSGSGKSTLMDCLNGRRRATAGVVLANGEDFYRYFDSFRQSLGYVPQRDIVHRELTVYRALHYTARLRLPTDTTPDELNERVERVLAEMDLEEQRTNLVAELSGGQIKRVSLGAELLARPSLLYIDEATSGLDAGTETRMMQLFLRLAEEGRSILCITHNVDNVDRCHLILVLSAGQMVYCGPPQDAPGYFQVARLSEVYDRLESETPEVWRKRFEDSRYHAEFVAKRLAAREPAEEERCGLAGLGADLISGVAEWLGDQAKAVGLMSPSETAVSKPPVLEREKQPRRWPPWWHQFRILTARYVELLRGDRRTVMLLLLQAPAVAVVLLIGFVGKPYRQTVPAPRPMTAEERHVLTLVDRAMDVSEIDRPLTEEQREALRKVRVPVGGGGTVTGEEVVDVVRQVKESGLLDRLLKYEGSVVPDRQIVNPQYTYTLLFILVIAVLWFGCNNAAKEIVKEEAIYSRERAVNLALLPYLASKFLVLSGITALQAGLLMLVVYGVLWLCQVMLGWPMPWPDHMLDYVPQFGVLALLSMAGVALGLLLSACVTSPDRASTLLPYVLIPQIILGGGVLSVSQEPLRTLAWLFSPVYWAFRAVHRKAQLLPPDWPMHTEHTDDLLLPCAALAAQSVVLLVLTAWCLWRKDASR